MRTSTRWFRVFILPIIFIQLILIGFVTVASAQLPPDILADKHLIHAEQLHAAKDYAGAFEVMQKIIALQKEHDLTVPDDFHFKYARVALSADSMQIALESVSNYLSATGKEGEFYQEALKVMLKAEGNEVVSAEDFYNDVIKTQGTCEGFPVGAKCWTSLTNHTECFVWNEYLSEGETAIWTGKCSGHIPDGEGTLTWYEQIEKDGKRKKVESEESTGVFRKGKREGKWVDRWPGDRYAKESLYVNGKQTGPWFDWYEDYNKVAGLRIYAGSIMIMSLRDPDAWSVEHEGPDENGDGHIDIRARDGSVLGGSYAAYNPHGKWVERGYFDKSLYVEREGVYVDGKKEGQWVHRHSNGSVGGGNFKDGKAHGEWVFFGVHWDGGWFENKGAFVDGKPHGEWVYRHSSGFETKGAYVDGIKHGEWVEFRIWKGGGHLGRR